MLETFQEYNERYAEDGDERRERFRKLKAQRRAAGQCWQCGQALPHAHGPKPETTCQTRGGTGVVPRRGVSGGSEGGEEESPRSAARCHPARYHET